MAGTHKRTQGRGVDESRGNTAQCTVQPIVSPNSTVRARVSDKLAALHEVERDNRRGVYLVCTYV